LVSLRSHTITCEVSYNAIVSECIGSLMPSRYGDSGPNTYFSSSRGLKGSYLMSKDLTMGLLGGYTLSTLKFSKKNCIYEDCPS
jgi:hypothetical protein